MLSVTVCTIANRLSTSMFVHDIDIIITGKEEKVEKKDAFAAINDS